MATIPQTNATVTVVATSTASQGQRDDWDNPAAEPTGAGATKWTGSERVYLVDRARRAPGPGGSTLVHDRSIVARSAWTREAGVDTDDEVTVVLDTGGTIVVRPVDIAVPSLPGFPDRLQTARLVLASE